MRLVRFQFAQDIMTELEEMRLRKSLLAAAEFCKREPEAHGEIRIILPNGEMIIIPAKNPHLLARDEDE